MARSLTEVKRIKFVVADFHFANHGSVAILTAISEDAKIWVDVNLPDDRPLWGPNGTVIEARFVGDILTGIHNDGLTIAG
jgi:hypothetical protein